MLPFRTRQIGIYSRIYNPGFISQLFNIFITNYLAYLPYNWGIDGHATWFHYGVKGLCSITANPPLLGRYAGWLLVTSPCIPMIAIMVESDKLLIQESSRQDGYMGNIIHVTGIAGVTESIYIPTVGVLRNVEEYLRISGTSKVM